MQDGALRNTDADISLHIRTTRDTLLPAVAAAKSATLRNSMIPILSYLALEGSCGQVTVTGTGTDLERRLSTAIDADVPCAGKICVPARTLLRALIAMDAGADIEIIVRGEKAMIQAGELSYHLTTLPIEDFPVTRDRTYVRSFVLSGIDLGHLITKVRHAISLEETRYYLNGIYLHGVEVDGVKMLRAVATDGHRLAYCQIISPISAFDLPGVIVPRFALDLLINLPGPDILVSLTDDSWITFEADHTCIDVRLIDGTFPDYPRVIPIDNDQIIEVETLAFSRALAQVGALTKGRSAPVGMTFKPRALALSVVNADEGVSDTWFNAMYDGAEMRVGFQVGYLLEALSVCGDRVRMAVKADGQGPALITDPADGDVLQCLMPMRL